MSSIYSKSQNNNIYLDGSPYLYSNNHYHSQNINNPYRKKHNPRNPSPWWNKECNALLLERKKALERFKSQKTRENFLLYKREIARTRIGLKNIKKESFRNFCENLRKDSNPTYVWNKIKALKNRANYSETKNKYNIDAIHCVRN